MTRGGLDAEQQIQRTPDHRDPKAVEAGRTVRDVCREHEISDATYYHWKSKYGGMQASEIKRLRELEDENRRLKQMSADLLLENRALKESVCNVRSITTSHGQMLMDQS
jgi:putative transposase